MIHAAIDIGTNTLLALVGRARGDRLSIDRIEDMASITRLGEGVDRTCMLAPEAMQRAIDALAAFVARARELGASRIACVATSAVRDAKNRDEFLARVRAIAGDDVQVISGTREAELTFAGAADGTGIAHGARALVFDVGGGSTEIIAGAIGSTPQASMSIDVGSVRLTERFVRHDPPERDEIDRIDALLETSLAAQGDAPVHDVLVGIAATVTTLAAIDRAEPVASNVRGARLSRSAVENVCERLVSVPLASRATIVGLDPRRADVIIAGARVVRSVLRWAGRDELVVSDGGVRVGLLLERASRPSLNSKG
jgi:exopolyphosphatase/guanosine-5'-triphosphate,3'-diphosphate pyrophosphatase